MVGRRMYLQRISRCMYMYAYPPWTKIPKYEEQNRDHDSGYSGKDESHVHWGSDSNNWSRSHRGAHQGQQDLAARIPWPQPTLIHLSKANNYYMHYRQVGFRFTNGSLSSWRWLVSVLFSSMSTRLCWWQWFIYLQRPLVTPQYGICFLQMGSLEAVNLPAVHAYFQVQCFHVTMRRNCTIVPHNLYIPICCFWYWAGHIGETFIDMVQTYTRSSTSSTWQLATI